MNGRVLADVNECSYCAAVNDINLRGLNEYTVSVPETDRPCPVCKTVMPTIDLKGDKGHFYIERCATYMGMFFDPKADHLNRFFPQIIVRPTAIV